MWTSPFHLHPGLYMEKGYNMAYPSRTSTYSSEAATLPTLETLLRYITPNVEFVKVM